MDYSEFSTPMLERELRRLYDERHGLKMLIANWDGSDPYEDIHELEGQLMGCEQLIEEIEKELNRRQSS